MYVPPPPSRRLPAVDTPVAVPKFVDVQSAASGPAAAAAAAAANMIDEWSDLRRGFCTFRVVGVRDVV